MKPVRVLLEELSMTENGEGDRDCWEYLLIREVKGNH